MSAKDDSLIFEKYLTISEAPEPAPEPAPAPAPAPTTADNLKPGDVIAMPDTAGTPTNYTVAADWRPGTPNINLTDSGGRIVSYPVADLNTLLANGTATVTPAAAPATAEPAQAPRTAAIAAEPEQPEQAGWATATRNVMGTGPDSGKIGGGLQGATGSKDWLTRGLMSKADQAVQALGRKAPKRGDAAVAYRQ